MRAVFFDLDGTLLENREHFPSVFLRIIGELGFERELDDVSLAIRDTWAWYEENVGNFRESEMAMWQEFNTRVCAVVGLGNRASDAGEEVTQEFQRLDTPRLYEDVLPCLDAVAEQGFRLGVITARPNAVRVIEPLGIVERFDWIVDGFSAGSAKQDERTFLYALRLAELEGDQTIHVGDQLQRDIEPARAAGMHTLLLDRDERHPDADCARLTSLEGFAEWLSEKDV